MAPPRLLPTNPEGETFAGVTYHVQGELVPALTIRISPDQPVFFEHNILLWKEPFVTIGMHAMKGAFKRLMAGMQVFITEARGQGEIAFSRDGAGHIFAIHLRRGEEIEVREHQFLAATRSIAYDYRRVRGISNMLFGGSGFFVDRFRAESDDGIVWLHGYGNVFEKVLAPGEAIDVEPGGWLYKDASVDMRASVQNISTGIFASWNFVTNRFTGPGRVGIQSMYLHLPTEE